ncbi:formate hydrogenlyase transcriptional activator [Edaphobacter aggregans]|uniref:Formate hydrogenlyase transcriptional activator n=1 Tax=Edaphobacter aggregans TaxID=570835 RepID=A0A428MNC2_9BACT|nr:sigma 54-interacting transcriptional regulator [Edaphobacter aggregans]RSL18399.1 formate hydrogenlyase transcriptional activator [Edaphobacter aggregans]
MPVSSHSQPVTLSESLVSRYEALARIAELIRSHPEEKVLFQTCASELHQVVAFDGLSLFDPAVHWVQWDFLEPYDNALEALAVRDIPKEETVAWWVYQNQRPVVIPSIDRETSFPLVVERLSNLGLRSLYAVPLSTAHRKLGSLVFASHSEDAYSNEDQQFLSLVANQIAVAMDDARAQARLRLLLDITNRIVTKLELRDLLRESVASIRHFMQCDSVGVALPDPEDGELRRYAVDYVGSEEMSVGSASERTKTVFRTGNPLIATKDEVAADPQGAMPNLSLCLYPLIIRERVLGVLGLGSSRENAFTEDDLSFLGQVANQIALAVENALAYGQVSELKDKLAQENVYLESEIRSELHFEDIVGNSEQLRRVLKDIETVAPADSTVLIYGETGTGKELIARALHELSSRKPNAFVKLNCAAIPTGLLESELFGHEKGAFTGAIMQRVGRFELANRGTIFLDEVGEIPLELQPKLLRVLQEREFERLGSTRTIRTDARLIAATNRDLKTMVEEQRFRSDLYYRLNVFPIRVPSLRERKEDIPLLVRHFVKEFSRRNHRVIDTIPSETMQALIRYQWPGNIRELQNVIERAVIISGGPVLNVAVAELTPDVSSPPVPIVTSTKPASHESLQETLEETERNQILRALEDANGVVAGPKGAAARLGVKRSTLQLRMQRLGIRLSRTAVDDRKQTAQ